MTASAQADPEDVGWFWKLFHRTLKSHARNTNLEFFKRKYPGLPAEAIAARRIKAAARFAGMVGFASGAAITVAGLTAVTSAVSTVASGLLASPVTVPALAISVPVGVAAFAAEIGVIVSIQLHLAYDLFVLYHLPVDVDDPEQMQEVSSLDWELLLADLAEVTDEAEQQLIFKTLLAAAIVEGELQRKKRQRLKSVADLYHLSFDEQQAKARVKNFATPKPTRTCLIVVLMLFVLTIFSCGICLVSLWLPSAQ